MDILSSAFSGILSGFIPFVLLLGILVFVHELGHFAVAKFFGVRVETFSIGFGKKLFQFKRGDTVYALSLIPLGGYVKMFGDDPSKEIPVEEQKVSFLHQPVWPRIAIVAAGPLINFFFAVLVFMAIAYIGEEQAGTVLGDISKHTAAYEAGFRSGDKVTAINGKGIETYDELNSKIESSSGSELSFQVERDGNKVSLKAKPKRAKNDNLLSSASHVGKIEGLTLESMRSTVGRLPNSPAAEAGFYRLSLIEDIEGQKVERYREILPALRSSGKDTVNITIRDIHSEEFKDTKTVQLSLAALPEKGTDPDKALAALGLASTETFLFRVFEDSPASRAGLQDGDHIVGLNGEPVTEWTQVLETISNYEPESGEILFAVQRADEVVKIAVTPELKERPTQTGQFKNRYMTGIQPAVLTDYGSPVVIHHYNPFMALAYGVKQSIKWTHLTLVGFGKLITGEVSARNVGGVISIGRVATRSFDLGVSAFLKIMAIISINLFLINLFPIPVLDGGHLLFFGIEAIQGAPLSLRKMEIAQTFGFVLLMSLMAFALFNDINNWLTGLAW